MPDTAGRQRVSRTETLVRWDIAAEILGRSPDTLDGWYEKGLVPAVRTPGQQKSTYRSWLDAVMSAARPGAAGDISAVARQWWAEHMPWAVEEVA